MLYWFLQRRQWPLVERSSTILRKMMGVPTQKSGSFLNDGLGFRGYCFSGVQILNLSL